MAIPRVFISSTCYDLHEIRYGLRNFILDFGLEPVMSEYGDIFFEYSSHVQDACLAEIEKCNLFILIIGNSYGSIYYKHGDSLSVPSSVTLKEFSKAIETKIPKHIFINRFVHYDYTNFKNELNKRTKKFFDENEISDSEIPTTISRIREEIDQFYPFPQESYKYIFHFLDIITDLSSNNAIFQFENFDDIKSQLKKQWAGFMFEQLTREDNVSMDVVDALMRKIDSIENTLQNIFSSRQEKEGSITINTDDIVKVLAIDDLERQQEIINSVLNDIIYDGYKQQRGELFVPFTNNDVLVWLSKLKSIANEYKWSKHIEFSLIFADYKRRIYRKRNQGVPYTTILKLSSIYESMSEDDRKALASTIMLKFKPILIEDKSDDLSDVPF